VTQTRETICQAATFISLTFRAVIAEQRRERSDDFGPKDEIFAAVCAAKHCLDTIGPNDLGLFRPNPEREYSKYGDYSLTIHAGYVEAAVFDRHSTELISYQIYMLRELNRIRREKNEERESQERPDHKIPARRLESKPNRQAS